MEVYLQVEVPRCPSCGHTMLVDRNIECINLQCADTTKYKRPSVELEPVEDAA